METLANHDTAEFAERFTDVPRIDLMADMAGDTEGGFRQAHCIRRDADRQLHEKSETHHELGCAF